MVVPFPGGGGGRNPFLLSNCISYCTESPGNEYKYPTILNTEYFMESVCVRYLRTSGSSIGNRTSERSERVRILIQTIECVNTVCIHFPWCIMFIIYILTFKCG